MNDNKAMSKEEQERAVKALGDRLGEIGQRRGDIKIELFHLDEERGRIIGELEDFMEIFSIDDVLRLCHVQGYPEQS